MKSKKRYFLSGILAHLYQRTQDGFLLFYNDIDYLVYFTIMCVVAPRYDIQVIASCQMPDHTHSGVVAQRFRDLASFMRDTSMWYARYGQAPQMKRGTPLYDTRHYGSAMKIGAKKARTNIVYIGNNPVERRLVKTAEEYRWNFLAYGKDNHPFSVPFVVRNASCEMKKAISEVKDTRGREHPLSYTQMKRLLSRLDAIEAEQLIDYAVSTYSVIDYETAASFFDSYDDMIGAMHYNTGSEYDINEVFVGRSDACYAEISTWLKQNLRIKDVHDVFLMDEDARVDLLFDVHRGIGADPKQIAKYLRLKAEGRFR